jgi:nucleotide-binding universal stress UspA family protein
MSVSLQTIVIGTSLSAVSDLTVRTGVAVARASGAAVWLVHVGSSATLLPEMRKGDGRGGFKRLVLGSIANEVVRHARCNVLMVPPPAAPQAVAARNRAREIQA